MNIGEQIRKLRRDADITQQALANKSGITQTYLSQIEKGNQSPSMEVLYKLAESLDTKVELIKLAQR